MRYFQTDADGFYIGEQTADVSPLEPGVFLIPGGCVTIAPPVVGVEKAARWVNGKWETVPDLRGRVYWLADHSRHEITGRGVSLPVGALDANPPDTSAETTEKTRAAAIRELSVIDLASIRSMREWIAAQASAPQILKDKEASAAIARAKLL